MLMPIVATLLATAPDVLADGPVPLRLVWTEGGSTTRAWVAWSPTVVFVHGWSCSLGVWRLQARAFAARVRALFVDLPGHGASDVPDGACTQDLFARAIDAVLRDAGAARDAVIVGHSNGVITARHFYRLLPGEDPRPRPGGRQPAPVRRALALSVDGLAATTFRSTGRGSAAVVDGMTDVPSLRVELRRLMTRHAAPGGGQLPGRAEGPQGLGAGPHRGAGAGPPRQVGAMDARLPGLRAPHRPGRGLPRLGPRRALPR